MGTGIEMARADAPEHAEIMENFKEQLLLAFLRKLGGRVSIPVKEVDETGGYLLAFNIVNGVFNFELRKKS